MLDPLLVLRAKVGRVTIAALRRYTPCQAVMDTISHFDSKIIIIAAHRLSTLRRCDAVYEVKDGRLVYAGPGEAIARQR